MKTQAYEASPFVEDELELLAEDHVPDDDEASFLNDYLAEDEDDWEHTGPMQPANEFPEEEPLEEGVLDLQGLGDFETEQLWDNEGIEPEYFADEIDDEDAGELFTSAEYREALEDDESTGHPESHEEELVFGEELDTVADYDAPVIAREVLSEGEKSQDAATIRTLIRQGFSENDITNIAFLARHPRLIGKAKLSSREARTWRKIRDREVRPLAKRMLSQQVVSPADLAVFLSQYESSDVISERHLKLFMTDAPLLSMGKSLRDKLLFRWRNGDPPATINVVYREAYRLCGDVPTALLLAQNVMKAFSKGGKAITWSRKEDNENHYTDGKKTFIPKKEHPAGRIITKKGRKSIFYLIFSSKQFGTTDHGDWYHYFVAATMSAFSGEKRLRNLLPEEEVNVDRFIRGAEDRAKGAVKDVKRAAYALLLLDRLLTTAQQMSNPAFRRLSGYRGWTLANVLSFLEGGFYGLSQNEVDRESKWHRKGALFGLRKTGVRVRRDWLWYVPAAGSLSKDDLVGGFTLRPKTRLIQNATGKKLS